MASDASQLRLALDAGLSDRLKLVRMLEGANVGLSLGRKRGVVELLVRLLLLARDPDAADVVVEAQVSKVAAGFRDRPSVGERTVRNWRRDAQWLGLVSLDWPGGSRWNTWVVHFARVAELLELGRSGDRPAGAGPEVVFDPAASGNKRQPLPLQAATIAASTGRSRNRVLPLPEPGAGPGFFVAGNRDDEASEGRGHRQRRRRSTIDTGELFDSVQALKEARGRRLAPLPLGASIAPGQAFACLKPEHLNKASSLLEWFRRQLSLPQPVLGPSEADFLLVLAAACWANRLPEKSIRANRVAAFVHVLTRGQWGRVLPCLADARAWLDRHSSTAEDSYTSASVGAVGPGDTLVPREEPCHTIETESL